MASQQASRRMVIALGGNIIAPPSQLTDVPHQFLHLREAMRKIGELIDAGHRIVLTHGNGPQVGNILRRAEMAAKTLYPVPLELCIADTQGAMGYMMVVALENEVRLRGIPFFAAVFITRVEVDPKHPEFEHPSKPIGIFYPEADARQHMAADGWRMVHVPDKGWRRVVPSPPPCRIMEIDHIRRLSDEGGLAICCGGGGIPVMRRADGEIWGVEAVIDKDRTAAVLAAELDCDCLVIVTGVPQVSIHFGKPQQRTLDRMTIREATQWLKEGHFPPGSMGPKVEAAIDFLQRSRHPDAAALITDDTCLVDAVAGKGGTWVVRDAE